MHLDYFCGDKILDLHGGVFPLCYHLCFGNWEGFSVSLRLINSLSQTIYERNHTKNLLIHQRNTNVRGKLQSNINRPNENGSRGSVTTKTQVMLRSHIRYIVITYILMILSITITTFTVKESVPVVITFFCYISALVFSLPKRFFIFKKNPYNLL